MKNLNQKGFALLESALIIGVIAILSLAGWNIYQRQQKNGSTSSTTTVKSIPVAPTISSAADLDSATKTLDQTQLDSSSDTAQLDKDLASF